MRRTAVKAFALAAALLPSAACGGPSAARDSDPTRTLFRRNCAACHGPRGEGKQLGTMTIPTLREGRPVTDSDAQLFKQVSDGGKGMPPFKYTLDDPRIEDLIRFVRKEIQKK